MGEIIIIVLAVLLLLIPLVCAFWSINCVARLFKNAQFFWAIVSIVAFISVTILLIKLIDQEEPRAILIYSGPFASLFLAGLGLTRRKETKEAGTSALN